MKEEWQIYKENRIKHETAMRDQYQGELKKLEQHYLSDTLRGEQVYVEYFKKNKENWLSLIKTREEMIQDILNETEEESKEQWDLEIYSDPIW